MHCLTKARSVIEPTWFVKGEVLMSRPVASSFGPRSDRNKRLAQMARAASNQHSHGKKSSRTTGKTGRVTSCARWKASREPGAQVAIALYAYRGRTLGGSHQHCGKPLASNWRVCVL